MSTRGFVGFGVNRKTKIIYNHSDSYPDWLGVHVLAWLRSTDLEVAKTRALLLHMVESGSEPTEADVSRAASQGLINMGVGGPTVTGKPSWYQILREAQGDPQKILEMGVAEDASYFPYDSLFCEWGYLIDFDLEVLEVYKGMQEQWHTRGRFISDPEDKERQYHSVALVNSWPFGDLPTDKEFLSGLEGAK